MFHVASEITIYVVFLSAILLFFCSFVFLVTPKASLVQLPGVHFFNWPLVRCLQLWGLQCKPVPHPVSSHPCTSLCRILGHLFQGLPCHTRPVVPCTLCYSHKTMVVVYKHKRSKANLDSLWSVSLLLSVIKLQAGQGKSRQSKPSSLSPGALQTQYAARGPLVAMTIPNYGAALIWLGRSLGDRLKEWAPSTNGCTGKEGCSWAKEFQRVGEGQQEAQTCTFPC